LCKIATACQGLDWSPEPLAPRLDRGLWGVPHNPRYVK